MSLVVRCWRLSTPLGPPLVRYWRSSECEKAFQENAFRSALWVRMYSKLGWGEQSARPETRGFAGKAWKPILVAQLLLHFRDVPDVDGLVQTCGREAFAVGGE